MPASRGAKNPPTLLEAVQKPQKVPLSFPANQVVRNLAQAGAPSPYSGMHQHGNLLTMLALQVDRETQVKKQAVPI